LSPTAFHKQQYDSPNRIGAGDGRSHLVTKAKVLDEGLGVITPEPVLSTCVEDPHNDVAPLFA
jgi:hypothetical protein